MKFKLIFTIIPFFLTVLMQSCTDVEVPVENELTPDNFPSNENQLILASGAVYQQLRGLYSTTYWHLQTLSTDEAILPARAGGWYDGARFQQLHLHSWNADHPQVGEVWRWGYGVISTSNQVLALFAAAPDSDAKAQVEAEVRAIRALAFFFMMDLYGNIPLSVEFGSGKLPEQKSRKEIFEFIESELIGVIPHLSDQVSVSTYGRPTKYMAYALLAKMYLNAEVYTNQERYQDAVEAADHVISSGVYDLNPDFFGMFAANNGPHTKEFIFAISYDWAQASGQQFTWYGLHYALQQKYNLNFRISGPASTTPEYYANFNDPDDIRTQSWLTGKQYDNAGNPIIIRTTKRGLDANYTGADGGEAIDYHLEFTPKVTLINEALFEAGGDELGRAKGYRNIKYAPDPNAIDRNASNDVPVFRYADILLIKAEALLRGAAATNDQTPLILVNELRQVRQASLLPDVNLEILLQERAREFSWEAWRRNDLIRYGKFEDSWGYKKDKDVNKRLFPIPNSERVINPLLTQNNGY